jgi:hypothetical protein
MSSRCSKIKVWVLLVVVLMVIQDAGAQTSPHGTLRWSCQSCHATDSWKMKVDASFDHTETGFLLEGQHKTLQCVGCHKDLKFTGTVHECTACHVDVHKSELGMVCTRCHTPQTWKITDMMNRHQLTRFPLLGRHATLDCEDCHAGLTLQQFLGTPITCYGCHRTDYQKTANPNHAAAGFSTDCGLCRKENAFEWGTGFDHAITKFPLTGAHLATPCSSCHRTTDFKNTPLECYACHQLDYQSTTAPNHVVGLLDHRCETCHSTTAWHPAMFDHSTTKFPLTGVHATTACASCHVSGNYQLVYSSCYTCHATEYTGTKNPVHSTAGFPTTCETCHTTTGWTGASFNHTWFPQNHGSSGGVCAKCHTNSANYAVFSCTTAPCHPQAQTDATHRGRTGYVYNSANCYSCHPRGNAG